MTWGQEVAHIMRKDVREQRWVIAGYLVVVALATANALAWLGSRNAVEGAMLLVVALGMLLIALLIQADSPTRPDAFWAMHPHRPSAVMSAKLALAALVIVLPAVIGQYVALSTLALGASVAGRMIIASAVLYFAWLLGAMVISAMTPDLRTFLLVIIVTPFILVFVAGLFIAREAAASINVSAAVVPVAYIAPVMLVAFLYRRRDTRRRMWIAAFGTVACTAYAIVFASLSAFADPASRAERAHKVALQFSAGRLSRSPAGSATLVFRMMADSALPGERIVFTPSVVSITLKNGKQITLRERIGEWALIEPALSVGTGIPLVVGTGIPFVVGTENPHGMRSVAIQIPARDAGFADIDVAEVRIEGDVRVITATLLGTMPFEEGASLTEPGTRVEVDRLAANPDPVVRLHVRSRVRAGTNLFAQVSGQRAFDVALVDDSARTARLLYPRGGRTFSGAMVLPGADVDNVLLELGVALPNGNPAFPEMERTPLTGPVTHDALPEPGTSWRRNARLAVIRWAPEGNYHVVSAAAQDLSVRDGVTADVPPARRVVNAAQR